ncbi:hypothetical protein [Mesorhizobium sp.]|uniref:hypothetical protein n=1 Tax=Mesorhizobium sp. TaxID=1871066 RepID=UPI000FE79C78|nr:hypothetical protein [Mesorhizobium sp.]RWP37980.1 MAG: hypothetical protein EOR03_03495 [Mesorhizobium sp.]
MDGFGAIEQQDGFLRNRLWWRGRNETINGGPSTSLPLIFERLETEVAAAEAELINDPIAKAIAAARRHQ